MKDSHPRSLLRFVQAVIAVLVISGGLIASTVTLSVDGVASEKNTRGETTFTVAPRSFFTVKAVVVSDQGRKSDALEVDGLNALHVQGNRSACTITMRGGVFSSETTHEYEVFAPEEGTYTLGPATVKEGGKTVASGSITVIAKRNAAKPVSRGRSDEQRADASEHFLRVTADKTSVVVGEPVIVSATFYSRGASPVRLEGFTKCEAEGGLIKEAGGFTQRKEALDGKTYDVVERKYIFTPLSAGEKRVKPLTAQYFLQGEHHRRTRSPFDSMFSDFFSSRMRREVVHSRDLPINVTEIPAQVGEVDAIGMFDQFDLALGSRKAGVNEPLTLKVTVAGEGNIEHMDFPRLALSDSLRFYQSKADFVRDPHRPFTAGKKVFEYVLQATQPGEIHIPAQPFAYFDTRQRRRVQLFSKPLALTVSGDAVSRFPTTGEQQHSLAGRKTPRSGLQAGVLDINFIEEDVPLFERGTNHSINIWVFILLLSLPLILFFSRSVSVLLAASTQRIRGVFSNDKPLAIAEKNLKELQETNNAALLYQFFLDYLSTQFAVQPHVVTEDWIRQTLIKQEWPFERIEGFLDYLHKAASFSFSAGERDEASCAAVIADAWDWLYDLGGKKA